MILTSILLKQYRFWLPDFPPKIYIRMSDYDYHFPVTNLQLTVPMQVPLSTIFFTEIRAFHWVAISGGVTRAAQILNVGQPSISRQLKSLENRYDVTLFVRQGRRMSLTLRGEQLLALTKGIFASASQADEFLNNIHGVTGGNLVVGTSTTRDAINVISRFRTHYPAIEIQTVAGSSGYIRDQLLASSVDVCFVADSEPHENIAQISLGSRKLDALVVKHHQLAERKFLDFSILKHNTLLVTREGAIRAVIDRGLAKFRDTPISMVQFDTADAVWQAVLAGIGVGILPRDYILPHSSIVTIPIREKYLKIESEILYLKGRKSPLLSAFLDIARETSQ